LPCASNFLGCLVGTLYESRFSDPPCDRGSSCFVGTAYSQTANPRRYRNRSRSESNPGPLTPDKDNQPTGLSVSVLTCTYLCLTKVVFLSHALNCLLQGLDIFGQIRKGGGSRCLLACPQYLHTVTEYLPTLHSQTESCETENHVKAAAKVRRRRLGM
jgi:hypothetical protein